VNGLELAARLVDLLLVRGTVVGGPVLCGDARDGLPQVVDDLFDLARRVAPLLAGLVDVGRFTAGQFELET
jgi:hypothetical protein